MAELNSILSGSLVFRDQGTYLSEIRPGPNSITITGSLNVSGSRVTVNGKDLVQAITVLESGQGADQVKFGQITLWTSSMNDWSSSVKDNLIDLNSSAEALNFFTGSISSDYTDLADSASVQDIRITSLESSGSTQEVRLQSLESIAIVSSSGQIASLGFLTASIGGIVSSSAQITRLGYITGSKFNELDDIPQGIVSSSTQIHAELLDKDLYLGTGAIYADNLSISGSIEIGGADVLAFLEKVNVFTNTGSFATANKDIQVTGSLDLKFDGVTNYFAITIDGEEKVKVNEEGILQLFAHDNAPTPVEGGLFFGNDDSLYLGVND